MRVVHGWPRRDMGAGEATANEHPAPPPRLPPATMATLYCAKMQGYRDRNLHICARSHMKFIA